MKAEIRTAAVVVVVSIVVGAVLGVVWWMVAPLVPIEVGPDGQLAFADAAPPQEFIGADGWFAVLVLVAGVVSGALAWWRLRRTAFGSITGLALGGVLGSVVMWQVGQWLGPGSIEASAQGLAEGDVFDAPLRLGAKGLLAVWSATAVGVYLAVDLVVDEAEPARPAPAVPPVSRDVPPEPSPLE